MKNPDTITDIEKVIWKVCSHEKNLNVKSYAIAVSLVMEEFIHPPVDTNMASKSVMKAMIEYEKDIEEGMIGTYLPTYIETQLRKDNFLK